MNKVQKLCVSALMTALVCVATMVVQIPIPLGYMHLGNVMILIAGICFGPEIGGIAGGVGSALADFLTGFAVWVIPTLLIKSIMGYAIGRIAWAGGRTLSKNKVRIAAANAAGILIMVAGYTVSGGLIYGSAAAGISQVPGLSMEGVLAVVIFYVLYGVLSVSGVMNRLAGHQA